MRLRVFIALLVLPWADLPAAAPAGPHTFTDQYGRTMVGEIVEVSGPQVKIRREDGQTYTLDLTQLSEADTAYITGWQRDHQVFRLRIEAETFHDPVGPTAETYHNPAGGNNPRNITPPQVVQNLTMGYEIKISNDNFTPATNLHVEYNVFVLKRRGYGGELVTGRIKGRAAIDTLAFKQTATFRTNPLAYTRTDTLQGISSQSAELKDLWVRVLSDDRVVAEYLTGETLRAEGWQPITPAVQAPAGQ